MKAMVLTAFAGYAAVREAELPRPVRKCGQLLIENHAAAVNPIDAKICTGTNFVCKKRAGDPFPWTLGFDFAGTVLEADADSRFKKGDRVAGSAGAPLHPCAYAEYLCADENAVVKLPDHISFEEGAGLITAGLTALSICDLLPKRAQRVAVAGGSGGVGHLLVRYLKRSGRFVCASCNTAHMDFLRPYVDEIRDHTKPWEEADGRSFDAVIDMPGGDTGKSLYALLKKDGIMITVPTITEEEVKAACPVGMSASGVRCVRDQRHYEALMGYAAEGIVLYISRALPLRDAQDALREIQRGHTVGKIILSVRV